MNLTQWIADNAVWLLGLAAACGYFKQKLDAQDKTLANIVEKLDAQECRVREFWQEKWPLVLQQGERITHLEGETQEIKRSVGALVKTVNNHILGTQPGNHGGPS